MPEEHLGAVDVADTGEDLLVHQEVADGARARRDAPPGQVGVGVGSQRVGPEAAEDLGAPGGTDQVADDGAAQVGVRRRARVRRVVERDHPQPHRADRVGHPGRAALDPRVDVELADQAEVDVHEALALVLEEEVLAGGVGADDQ